jgi:MFS family permease
MLDRRSGKRMMWTSKKNVLLVLLCYSSFFLFCDQNALAPNLSQIANEFGYYESEKDQKLGADLALGFFLVGAPAALLLGCLADSLNRVRLIAFVFALSGLACLATYFSRTYDELYVARIITGIGIGGSQPLVYSLLGDLFSTTERTLANTYVGLAAASGVAVGQLLAGELGSGKLGWRFPFLVVSLPALVGVVLILALASEPQRGAGEEEFQRLSRATSSSSSSALNPIFGAAEFDDNKKVDSEGEGEGEGDSNVSYTAEAVTVSKLLAMFRTPSLLLVFLQGLPGCLPWGMIGVYLNDYLSSNRGLSVRSATIVLTCFNVGSRAGGVVGGVWGQRLFNIRPTYQICLMASSTLLAIGPLAVLINAPASGTAFYFCALFGGVVASLNGPNVRSVLQAVIPPELRGSAFALFTICDDLGKAGGPALIVLLISSFGRQAAFNVNLLGWAFCAALLFLISFFFVKDMRVVQERVRSRVRQAVPEEDDLASSLQRTLLV